MDTHFATPLRADPTTLAREIEAVADHPLMRTLLEAFGGLAAVLNEQRQIVAFNDAFVASLGADRVEGLEGLRPGEAVECIHAADMPGGCGTGRLCATCGAAAAIVTALAESAPAERTCSLIVERRGRRQDLFLAVRATPCVIAERRFVLVSLRDITEEQNRAALERVFLHDLRNTLVGLVGAADLLVEVQDEDTGKLPGIIKQQTERLYNEVELQRLLLGLEAGEFRPRPWRRETPVATVLEDVERAFVGHPLAHERKLVFDLPKVPVEMITVRDVLARVVINMVTNALEASAPGDTVRVAVQQDDAGTRISVANPQAIPPAVAGRIFQRNFSTKPGTGRGLGTFAMKLFTERFLGGEVGFTTAARDGTVFTVTLPANPG